MPRKAGKNIVNARKKVEARPYKLDEAAETLKKAHFAKFDETVEHIFSTFFKTSGFLKSPIKRL